MTAPIVLSPKAARALVTVQSILIGLQTVAAASILGDVIGARWAALFIVLVSGAQQSVNYYANKSVAEAVAHVEGVVSRAEAVTDVAKTATADMASATAAFIQQTTQGEQQHG